MISWCQELLKRDDWVILDTETTGLGSTDQIVQIGVISQKGDVLLDRLVRPTISIPTQATAIHGITDEMVSGEDTLEVIYPLVCEATIGKEIIVYNGDYDYRMFEQSLAAVHNTYPGDNLLKRLMTHMGKGHPYFTCVMRRYAEHWGDWNDYFQSYRWQKLTEACRQQGVPIIDAHTALGDCQMTLGLIKELGNRG